MSNNTVFNITKISFFYVNKEFHSRMNIEFSKEESYNNKKVAVDQFASRMQELETLLRKQMIMIQVDYEQYVNKSRASASLYKADDMIYLSIENIVTRRSCVKLDHKNIDSYRIIKMIDSASAKLNLSSNIQDLHSVFHVHLLSSTSRDLFHSEHVKSSSSSVFTDVEENEK